MADGQAIFRMPLAISHQPSAMSRFSALHEREAIPFGERAYGFEAVRFKRALRGVGETWSFRRA
jgi:hypothetical protein